MADFINRQPRFLTDDPELNAAIQKLGEDWVPDWGRDLFHDLAVSALYAATAADNANGRQVRVDREAQTAHVITIDPTTQRLLTSVEKHEARRNLRILTNLTSELAEAFAIFSPFRDVKKVTMYGSARIGFGTPMYELFEETARMFAEHGWMVITGAGPGLMEAGNRGAGKDSTFGVRIRLPFEQQVNEFLDADKRVVTFRYFFTRMLMFVREAHAFVIGPGGYGTDMELSEVIGLSQTGKVRPIPVTLLDHSDTPFWKVAFVAPSHLKEELGLIRTDDKYLWEHVRSAEDAYLSSSEFYRVYHSTEKIEAHPGDINRYHVIRLQPRTSENAALLDRITPDYLQMLTQKYRGIIRTGSIEEISPTTYELERGLYPDLRRLGFHSIETDASTYIRLVNELNGWVPFRDRNAEG